MQAPLLKIAESWLAERGAAGLAAPAKLLSNSYRSGKSSAGGSVDVRAYVAARLPATYAAVASVFRELANVALELEVRTLLDLGSGPGTACWAAAEQWPQLSRIDMVDHHQPFMQVARELCAAAERPVLATATLHAIDMGREPMPLQADIVVAAYSFTELAAGELVSCLEKSWKAAGQALVIVEPGTPAGFARILAARRWLVDHGGHILAPCPHGNECPLQAPDWCHFSARLARSRLHMHAKQASVPYEDEKFSYLVVTRQAFKPARARILGPPRPTKPAIEFRLCTADGLGVRSIVSRDKPAFKVARKLSWGESFELDGESMAEGQEHDA